MPGLVKNVGSVEHSVGFKIDRKSWSNLDKFQKRISQVKKQLNSLKGGVKIQAKVEGMKSLMDGSRGPRKVKQESMDAHVMARKKSLKEQRVFEDAVQKERLRDIKIEQKAREKAHAEALKVRNALEDKQASKQFAKTTMTKLSTKDLDRYNIAQEKLNRRLKKGTIEVNRYRAASDRLTRSFKLQNKQAKTLNERFLSLRRLAVAGSITFAAFEAGASIKRTAEDYDRINSTLIAATGTADGAAKEFQWLSDVTNKWGVNTVEASKAYSLLMASAKDTKTPLEDIRSVFEATTMAATAFGLSQDDMAGAMRAYVQTVSKGQLMSEELSQQLGDRLPKVLTLAAQSMGLTVQELKKQMEKGSIAAEDFFGPFAKALKDFSRTGAELQAKKTQAATARLVNEFNELKKAIWDAGFGDFVTQLIRFSKNSIKAFKPFLKFITRTLTTAFSVATYPIRLLMSVFADLFSLMDNSTFMSKMNDLSGVLAGVALGVWSINKALRTMRYLLFGTAAASALTFGPLYLSILAIIGVIGTLGWAWKNFKDEFLDFWNTMPSWLQTLVKAMNPLAGFDEVSHRWKDLREGMSSEGMKPNAVTLGTGQVMRSPNYNMGSMSYRNNPDVTVRNNFVVTADSEEFKNAFSIKLDENNSNLTREIQANKSR